MLETRRDVKRFSCHFSLFTQHKVTFLVPLTFHSIKLTFRIYVYQSCSILTKHGV